MVSHRKAVNWDEEAKAAFRKAIAYIKKDSPQNADNVKKEILASTKALADEPERQHTPDKNKVNNDGRFRAYQIYHFRISYFVGNTEIRIVRFRHTSQQPERY